MLLYALFRSGLCRPSALVPRLLSKLHLTSSHKNITA